MCNEAQQHRDDITRVLTTRGVWDRDAVPAHEALFAVYDRIVGDVHVPDVLREVADVVCIDFNAERATVYIINRETECLESVAVIGNVARTITVPIDPHSLAGYCAVSGRMFVVPDAYGDLSAVSPELAFDRSWDKVNHFRTRDVMCAPALFKGEPVGVVQVMNRRDGIFTAVDLPLLGSVARLIGYALHNARLYDDLASLKKLDREKAQFMRTLVHELKSPAAAAKMLTDMLTEREDLDAELHRLHDRIAGRMEEMLGLISDILLLARCKAGGKLGTIMAVDLVSLTAEICRKYRIEAERKSVAMELLLPGGELKTRIDADGCGLIVSNLVSNAVKYTLEGTVRVHLRREDRWVVLDVADSGIGIPEEDIPMLFTEFFRASNAKKHKIRGSGVGLAGIRNIVERFGGEMELQSVENEGSTFTVRLPYYEEEQQPVTA